MPPFPPAGCAGAKVQRASVTQPPEPLLSPWSVPLLLCVLLSPQVLADERLFTYSYEPKTLPKGALEFEQWATLRAGKESGRYSRWDLRSELEYGLLDNLTTALYLNLRSTRIDNDEEQEDEFEFKGISSEWKYKFTDPAADPIGILGYGEVTTDGEELELEEKLVLGKEIDRFVLACNIIAEQEWEFEDEGTEKEWALEFTAGAAYRISDHFALGIELREKNVFPDMEDLEHAAFFAGPVVHYSTRKWWITFTVLPQIVALKGTTGDSVNLDEFERAEFRVILGIHF